jgi:alpha-mannosidase
MTAAEIRTRLQDCEILVVPYCHADWAWTHTRQWHVRRYVHAFERVLQIMREDASFRWYFDSDVTQLQPLRDHRPDLLPELRRRVAEGRIAICGGFANVRPNMVGDETFIRSLILGRRHFRALFPEADLSLHADLVDVALGHAQVPQLLALGGYRHARFWRPQAGLTEAGVPYEFIWRGADGSEILCSRGCYGGLCSPDSIPADYRTNWDAAVEHMWARELELVSRHAPTGIVWVSQGMDDALPLASHGGDVALDVPGFIAEWNAREQAPMRFATPLELHAALESRRERIPTVTGTLDPCDVCYNAAWGGSEGLWRKRVVADAELVRAQLWAALLPEARRSAAPRPTDCSASRRDAPTRPDDLWESILLFSAHATQWLFQDDFDELDELADRTILQARQWRRETLRAMARRIPQPENCAAIIFNSLPVARREIARVLLTHSTGLPESLEVRDGAGHVLPHQLTAPMTYAGRTWEAEALVEVEVPACGYTTVSWHRAEAAGPREGAREDTRAFAALAVHAPPVALDNGLVALDFEAGAVAGVRWGGERLAGQVPWGGLRLYDVDTTAPLHVGPILATHAPTWSEPMIVEHGPLRWRAVSEGCVGPHELRLETKLYAHEARIEFSLTVHWQGHDGFLASVWPMPCAGTLHADTPFGVEARELDAIRYGEIPGHRSNNIERRREGMFYAKSWVSLSDGRRGVTYLSHDGDRYFIRDAGEQSLAHLLINSVLPAREGWEQYVNCQREARGRHTFSWSIALHEGDWQQWGIGSLARRVREPLEVLLPEGAADPDLPAHGSLLSLEPEHVALSALYEDEGAIMLRVWESEGRAAEAVVQLPWPVATAELVDFNGEVWVGPPPQTSGIELRLSLRPWQIATVRLVRG